MKSSFHIDCVVRKGPEYKKRLGTVVPTFFY